MSQTTLFDVVIKNEWLTPESIRLIFNDHGPSNHPKLKDWPVKAIYLDTDADMYDVLVACGIFKSKGEAKRNWKRSGPEIPNGYSDFDNVGKYRHIIGIYKPFFMSEEDEAS